MRKIDIDTDGYIFISEKKVLDDDLGHELLKNFYLDDSGVAYTKHSSHNKKILINYFNQTLIVQELDFFRKTIQCLYGYSTLFKVKSLSTDQWQRIHGLTQDDLPFLLSHKAQSALLQTIKEGSCEQELLKKALPYYEENLQINNSDRWNQAYQKKEDRWSLTSTSPALQSIFPLLKKNIFNKTIKKNTEEKSALVLGAGLSHDAAFLAKNNFNTTAVDISSEAISQAKKLYENLNRLNFLTQDFFNLKTNPKHLKNYDIIFEQTCFCAINPKRRTELVRLWKSLLKENGLLIGVFFIMQKTQGPPFGISQWELKNLLLSEGFKIHLWTRADFKSHPKRQHKEVFICAEPLNKL